MAKLLLTESVDFNRFWARYPRRVAKQEALKAWHQLKPSPELVRRMLEALDWQIESWDDPKYIPHPASWLRGGRWDDEPVVELAPKPVMSEAAASVFRVIGGKAS